MKILYHIIKILFTPILWLIYGAGFFIKKNPNIWIFCNCDKGFFGNQKYAFLLADPGIRKVWVASDSKTIKYLKSLGYEVYSYYSIRYVFIALRAKLFIYDNVILPNLLFLSGGATRVNLWHGMPIKKIEADDTKTNSSAKRYHKPLHILKNRILNPGRMMKPSIFLGTNKQQADLLINAFKAYKTNKIIAQNPRTVIWQWTDKTLIKMLECNKDDESIAIINECRKYKKVYCYCPTFRDSGNFNYGDIIQTEKINEILSKRDELLIVKLHQYVNLQSLTGEIKNNSHIIFLSSKLDIYPILKYVDVLISDYSSILFDFLILDKPICFAIPDLNSYLAYSRDMYYDFKKEILCGPEIDTLLDLFPIDLDGPIFREKRDELKKRFCPDLSAAPLVDQLLALSRNS